MPRAVLIPQHGRDVKTYGVNYNTIHTMKSTLICLIVFIFHFYCVLGELEFYPDFRRPDPVLKWENEQTAEEYALEQFTSYLQEQQRRLALEREPEPDFTYSVPVRPLDDTPEFAVAPPDPRYYQNTPEEDDEEILDNNFEPLEPQNQLNQEQPSYQQQRSPFDNDELPYYQNQPQVNPDDFQDESNLNNQPQQETIQPIDNNIVLKTRTDDLKPPGNAHKLLELDLLRMANGGYKQRLEHPVDITPVHSQDDTAGVYIIAVVAGISAAATVALIAFAIGWYNLQKNVKNASDVEYPAYGVTGPNKDVSPTGDRRLAQSAQMYHYQHQKQQIIAMESRAAATVRHGSMSEAESDEENEEGDYTVYECPGLAPAGEMEVKNPLFQDDPTPASQAAKDEESLPDQK